MRARLFKARREQNRNKKAVHEAAKLAGQMVPNAEPGDVDALIQRWTALSDNERAEGLKQSGLLIHPLVGSEVSVTTPSKAFIHGDALHGLLAQNAETANTLADVSEAPTASQKSTHKHRI